MTKTRRGNPRATAALLVLGLGVVIALPLLLSSFAVTLFALFIPFAILAYSVALLWGENRILSFGHGAFFAAGAYMGGLILLGRTHDLSGFSSFLGEEVQGAAFDRLLEVLNALSPFGIPIVALVLPSLVVGLVALIVGLVVFRVGSPELYAPLVTVGIAVIASLGFNNSVDFGASNGLSGVPSFTRELSSSPTGTYWFNAVFLVVLIMAYARFRSSRSGLIYRSSGDDPIRLESLGYNVRSIRAAGFAASAALAAFAGVLYVATSNYIGPATAGILFGSQVLVWVAVGGSEALLGPLVGVLVVKWGEQFLSSELGLEDVWPLFLGLALILVVLVAPGGLSGLFDRHVPRRRRVAGMEAPPVRRVSRVRSETPDHG